MARVIKDSPTGIDKPIDKVQKLLNDDLTIKGWTNFEGYHRVYNNETEEGIRPERYKRNGEYEDVFTNDDFDATFFFVVPDVSVVVNGSLITTEVGIIFQINLDKIFPDSPHRADAEAQNQIVTILRKLGGNFSLVNIVRRIGDVYAEFDTTKVKWADIHKGHVVRFNVNMNYTDDCNDVFAVEACTISVVVTTTPVTSTGGSDGTATATPSGAQGNVTFLWSDSQTTQTAVDLKDGTISVMVNDDIFEDCEVEAVGEIGTINNILNLDPSDPDTINPLAGTPSNGDPIATIADLSINSNDCTQATPLNRLTWGTDRLNTAGISWVQSDSTDFDFTQNQSFSVMIWGFSSGSGLANQQIISKTNGNLTGGWFINVRTSSNFIGSLSYSKDGITFDTLDSGVTRLTNTWYAFVIVHDAENDLMKISVSKEGDLSSQPFVTEVNTEGVFPETGSFNELKIGKGEGTSQDSVLNGAIGKCKIFPAAITQPLVDMFLLDGH